MAVVAAGVTAYIAITQLSGIGNIAHKALMSLIPSNVSPDVIATADACFAGAATGVGSAGIAAAAVAGAVATDGGYPTSLALGVVYAGIAAAANGNVAFAVCGTAAAMIGYAALADAADELRAGNGAVSNNYVKRVAYVSNTIAAASIAATYGGVAAAVAGIATLGMTAMNESGFGFIARGVGNIVIGEVARIVADASGANAAVGGIAGGMFGAMGMYIAGQVAGVAGGAITVGASFLGERIGQLSCIRSFFGHCHVLHHRLTT